MKIFFTFLSLFSTVLINAQIAPEPPYTTCNGHTAGSHIPAGIVPTENGTYVMYEDGSNASLFEQTATGGSLDNDVFIFDVFRFNEDGSPLDTIFLYSENYEIDPVALELSNGDYLNAYSLTYDSEVIEDILKAFEGICEVITTVNGDNPCETIQNIIDDGVVDSFDEVFEFISDLYGEAHSVEKVIYNLDTLNQIITALTPTIGLEEGTNICFAYDGLTKIEIKNSPYILVDYTDKVAASYNTYANKNDETITSIQNLSETVKLNVQPNPASNFVNIAIQQANENMNLSVFDLLGNLVHNEQIPKGKENMEINVQTWNKGVFFLQVKGENGSVAFSKLIIN